VIETTCGPTVIAGEAARITASFGISTQEEGATTLSELINQADQALYLAKASGRNRVCRFEQKSSKHDPVDGYLKMQQACPGLC